MQYWIRSTPPASERITSLSRGYIYLQCDSNLKLPFLFSVFTGDQLLWGRLEIGTAKLFKVCTFWSVSVLCLVSWWSAFNIWVFFSDTTWLSYILSWKTTTKQTKSSSQLWSRRKVWWLGKGPFCMQRNTVAHLVLYMFLFLWKSVNMSQMIT